MTKTFLLFTTSLCSKCSSAKKLLETAGIKYELMNASTPEGLEKARKYEITQVPTLIILEEGKIISKAHDIDEIEQAIKMSEFHK